jgi:predicted naringenin-chalcone synthase
MKVLALHESLIPHSTEAMTWKLTDWGFRGSLSKKIPLLIANNLKGFLEELSLRANITLEVLLQQAVFAIHPGGPKILDYIQELLNLSDEQLLWSRQILRTYGNISSATLPHIWEGILRDEGISTGTAVVSLAFGPGLTIAGSILEKS